MYVLFLMLYVLCITQKLICTNFTRTKYVHQMLTNFQHASAQYGCHNHKSPLSSLHSTLKVVCCMVSG